MVFCTVFLFTTPLIPFFDWTFICITCCIFMFSWCGGHCEALKTCGSTDGCLNQKGILMKLEGHWKERGKTENVSHFHFLIDDGKTTWISRYGAHQENVKMLINAYLYLVALILKIRNISKISEIFRLFWTWILYDKAQIKKTVFLSTIRK